MNTIHVLSRGVIVDQDHILLCTPLDVPISFYFLPGGHVNHGESVTSALSRELIEETGAECHIKRFLGCLEYTFEPLHSNICHTHEYSFIFEVESKILNRHYSAPKCEDNIDLCWMPLKKLTEINLKPEPLKNLIPHWLTSPPSNTFESMMI